MRADRTRLGKAWRTTLYLAGTGSMLVISMAGSLVLWIALHQGGSTGSTASVDYDAVSVHHNPIANAEVTR